MLEVKCCQERHAYWLGNSKHGLCFHVQEPNNDTYKKAYDMCKKVCAYLHGC